MIIKCDKGKHYYENDKYTRCPLCKEAERIAETKVKFSEETEKQTACLTETQ